MYDEVGEESERDGEGMLGTGDRLLECSETSGIASCGPNGTEILERLRKEEEVSLSDEAGIIWKVGKEDPSILE